MCRSQRRFDITISMEMKLTTVLMHCLSTSPVVTDHIRDLNGSSSAGFSVKLVSMPDDTDHSVRRGSDGFLYLQHNSATNLTSVLSAAHRPAAVFIEVGTGAGKEEFIMMVSTTSPLTWLQCKPCSPMAPQMQPLFDPAASPTYHAFASASPRCPRPPYHEEPSTGLCIFHLASLVSARGYLSTDHFRIIGHGGVDPFYAFGCAHFTWRFNSEGRAAGVLTMGRAPASFVTQAAARGLTSFSYCLSSETSCRQAGFLQFGADVPSDHPYRGTKILPPAQGAHESAAYYVSLVGISVGEQRLAGVHPEMFARRVDGQGRCIIDLGTPVTVLVEEVYRAVEDAVWSGLERRGAERVDSVEQAAGYGLCVRAAEAVKGNSLPSLLLNFAGQEEATLVVSPEKLFVMVGDGKTARVACLAVTPGRRTVIGAFQQMDTRFVFDLKEDKISFAPESCARDTVELN